MGDPGVDDAFGDLVASGRIEKTYALPEEANEPELLNKPRIAFNYDHRSAGRLTQLVDLINKLRERGMDRGAAIREAARLRLRPIMMTTLTTVLGLTPMALGLGEGSEMRTPMAITVIGGLLTSTFLTLVVVPVMYSLLDRRREMRAETTAAPKAGSGPDLGQARVIEAGRITCGRNAPEGKVWIRIFPHKSITKKPAETRQGSGKGDVDFWAAVVKPGTILYELDGVSEAVAKRAFNRVAHKLPVKVRLVRRRHN